MDKNSSVERLPLEQSLRKALSAYLIRLNVFGILVVSGFLVLQLLVVFLSPTRFSMLANWQRALLLSLDVSGAVAVVFCIRRRIIGRVLQDMGITTDKRADLTSEQAGVRAGTRDSKGRLPRTGREAYSLRYSEHSYLSTAEIHARIEERLAQGKSVGVLLEILQNRGEANQQYQSRRATQDSDEHSRQTRASGATAPEEAQELQRRRKSASKSQKKPLRKWLAHCFGKHDLGQNCKCRICSVTKHKWDHDRESSRCQRCGRVCTHPNLKGEPIFDGAIYHTVGSYYGDDGVNQTGTLYTCPDCNFTMSSEEPEKQAEEDA